MVIGKRQGINVKIVSVAEMVGIENDAAAGGLDYEQMIENAGKGIADKIYAHSHNKESQSLGLIGSGNNGNDTLVALTNLAQRGWSTAAYLAGDREENDLYITRLKEKGGKVFYFDEDSRGQRLKTLINNHTYVLDGLLGTGFKLPLRENISRILARTQSTIERLDTKPVLVAIDCSSGVNCDTGEVSPESLKADITLCMAAIKIGMLKFPAFELLGEVSVVDIGLPSKLKALRKIKREMVDKSMVKDIIPDRPMDAHKGTFGSTLVVAGSINYTGAALLAGKAAYLVGSGLVNMAVPSPLYAPLAGHFPEATWVLLPNEMGVINPDAVSVLKMNLAESSSVLVGPGIGLEGTTKDFLGGLLKLQKASFGSKMGLIDTAEPKTQIKVEHFPGLVIDADGLKLIAQFDDWYKNIPPFTVLTPHPGEMAILTGISKDEIQESRLAHAERFAKKWGHIVVLKGAVTVIASPVGKTSVVPIATPALARAGTGDVLAGMIAGLLAQGVDPFPAAYAAVWLHAKAGLAAAIRLGTAASVLAGDLLEMIPGEIAKLNN